jgi:glycosyltransferase involved in cell wall biosynthesis
VATPNGGTSEVIEDQVNGLLFAPGNAEDLAERIRWLICNPDFRYRLAQAGRRTVLECFTYPQMMDKIEKYLLYIARLAHSSPEEILAAPGSPGISRSI